eukprot:2438911-Rhodomonas_salina.1
MAAARSGRRAGERGACGRGGGEQEGEGGREQEEQGSEDGMPGSAFARRLPNLMQFTASAVHVVAGKR